MTSAWEKTAPSKKRKLNPRHQRLIDFYFGPANFYKTRALRMAGYAKPDKYLRLFDHPQVSAEVERRYRELRERQAITYDNISQEIAKIAFASLLDYATVDRNTGDLLVDFRQAEAAHLAAIGEVTVETYVGGKGEAAREVKRVRVKPYNKLQALEMLMKHAGLSKDTSSDAAADLAGRIIAGQRRIAKKTGSDEEEGE
jgi:phage terminase small subunit